MLHAVGDRDSGFGEAPEPPPSLWKLVEEYVPRSERPEIRRILGEAAVDLSLELHAEVETLLELKREMCFTGPTPPVFTTSTALADPPAIKDMVKQEIRMLLFSIRQKARREGRDENHAVSRYNTHVVSFVMGTGRPSTGASRPVSTKGRISGPEVSSRPWTASSSSSIAGSDWRSVSSLSTGSSLGDDLEDLKEKFNISDIDDVVAHLQSVLEEECRILEKDITFLQSCLEEEHSCAADLMEPTPEPTLTELKEERRAIERDLQDGQSDPIALHPHRTSAHAPRQLESLSKIPAKPVKPPTQAASYDKNIPPGIPCPRRKIETLHRLSSSARTPVSKDISAGISKGTPSKPSPPATATIRRAESAIPELRQLQLDDAGRSTPNLPSATAPSLQECMRKVPPGQLGVLTMSSTPSYMKARLSHLRPTTSSTNMSNLPQGLQNATLTSTDLVFIPTPPSNHRPLGKPALPATNTATASRRVKLLKSNPSA